MEMRNAPDPKTKRNRKPEHSDLKKAKILAAKRSTSISRLLAEQIDALVGEDDAYEIAQRGLWRS